MKNVLPFAIGLSTETDFIQEAHKLRKSQIRH